MLDEVVLQNASKYVIFLEYEKLVFCFSIQATFGFLTLVNIVKNQKLLEMKKETIWGFLILLEYDVKKLKPFARQFH